MATPTRISTKDLEAKISSDLARAFKSEVSVPYNFQFRSSKLPICNREYVIHHRFPKENRPIRGEEYTFNFYVKIGSAVHEVVQRFLGMDGFLYGDWTCCGVTDHLREGSKLCPVCEQPQLYGELAPESELGMHVDGVSITYNAVTEFKTTSAANIIKLKDPYDTHMIQASCYLHALNAQYGWSLNKLIFVYFSRDNPKEYKVLVRRPLKDVYDETLEGYVLAQRQLKEGVLPDKVCETVSDGTWRGCSYSGVCFSPVLEKMLIPAERLLQKHE